MEMWSSAFNYFLEQNRHKIYEIIFFELKSDPCSIWDSVCKTICKNTVFQDISQDIQKQNTLNKIIAKK